MDLRGSLVHTKLIIYPSTKLLEFLESIPTKENVPANILSVVKGKKCSGNTKAETVVNNVDLNNEELKVLNKIKEIMPHEVAKVVKKDNQKLSTEAKKEAKKKTDKNIQKDSETSKTEFKNKTNEKDQGNSETTDEDQTETKDDLHINTQDIDWLFSYLQTRRNEGEKDVPYLHILLEGSTIEVPENQVMKRNPVLEARCVKLRAQQEAREYRSMTKGVDNVRIRYPEDTISYQLKQMNRQLIAIGQFILSIFAGFLFGFRGIEWMVGSLDFGFRLLLGVMCALVIALAEIYFLAKKLNEELSLSQAETIQIGGPPKLLKDDNYTAPKKMVNGKEHQD